MHFENSYLVFLILFILASQSCVISVFAEAKDDEPASVLAYAQDSIASAYLAVVQAEETGANVSSLLVQLNAAEGFLAQAHVAYKLGDVQEATRLANLCSNASREAEDKAVELQAETFKAKTVNLWLTMTFSLVSAVVIGFGSFWGWRLFTRRYHRRILHMKPEVISDES